MHESPITTNSSGEVVISPRGPLNRVTARALRDQLHTQVQSGNAVLVVDLAAVDVIDSAGLGALISGLKAARIAGGGLRITNPSVQVREILKLTNLQSVFEPRDSADGDSA